MPGHQNLQRNAAALSASAKEMGSSVWLNNTILALHFHRDADPATKDTSDILRITTTNMSPGSLNRAVSVITSPVMQEWMTSTVSRPLIVNGYAYPVEDEVRELSLSFFCAKLVVRILSGTFQQLAGGRGIFAIRWFCGQHTCSSTDDDASPSRMLSNMVGQLASQLLGSPLVPQLGHLPQTEENPPLSTLCSLFTELVKSLPEGSVLFIVIDGIHYYEDDARREECKEVLSTMTELARGRPGDTNNGPLIKLLVTDSLKSHDVQRLFADSDGLDLDSYIERSDGSTESRWNMRMSGTNAAH